MGKRRSENRKVRRSKKTNLIKKIEKVKREKTKKKKTSLSEDRKKGS